MSLWRYVSVRLPHSIPSTNGPADPFAIFSRGRASTLALGSTMAWAGLGLFLSDKAEEVFGLKPTENDKEGLKAVLPRVRRVD
ncbi:MAG: hypothetical protein ALECFALPRED_009396 [Alectoria fallacina]|uniref:Uncharacterized protein n=1 Tax=Alectoria fallacina TaxID=1903189 RepID=A0A8H3EGB2_9LECA|nr:MAG: hypothetical protein ALECFALPRED_009396 [Alectoria fallacina]